MSYISTGNTTNTAFKVGADTTGNLIFATGSSNTTALTLSNAQAATFAGAVSVAGNATVSGNTSFTGSVNAPNTFGFKNRIINGAMPIWQRGTSITITGAGSVTYTADRWWGICNSGSSEVVSQSTDVPTGQFQYSLKMQRPNGNANTSALNIIQIIETANCYDLTSQSVTLSFWAKKGANYSGGDLSINLQTGTVADQGSSSYFSWTGKAFPINTTQTLTTTWTKYSFTGTFGAGVLEAGVQLQFTPTGTAGADDSIYVTGVQIEVGSQATSFDVRPYGTELALCQRYFETFGTGGVGISRGGTAPGATMAFSFKVTKRASPTVTLNASSTIYAPATGTYTANAFGGSNGTTPNGISCDLNTSGTTASLGTTTLWYSSGDNLWASAEL